MWDESAIITQELLGDSLDLTHVNLVQSLLHNYTMPLCDHTASLCLFLLGTIW